MCGIKVCATQQGVLVPHLYWEMSAGVGVHSTACTFHGTGVGVSRSTVLCSSGCWEKTQATGPKPELKVFLPHPR